MIECRGLVKRFGASVAVDEVSMRVEGGICALLGPNGAGKSTLLKLMTGLLVADAGEVRIAGLDLAREPDRVKRLIGVLPEELGLFDALTVREHLEMVGPVYGLNAQETAMRGDGLLKMLRLDHAGSTLLSECSYGMRKKTGIAMAMLHNPRVLILDEPFEGIDPSSTYAIQQTLTDAAKKGVTVLMTSHLLPLVERLATQVVILKAGRVVLDTVAGSLDASLEETYFGLVGVPAYEELAWLGA